MAIVISYAQPAGRIPLQIEMSSTMLLSYKDHSSFDTPQPLGHGDELKR